MVTSRVSERRTAAPHEWTADVMGANIQRTVCFTVKDTKIKNPDRIMVWGLNDFKNRSFTNGKVLVL